jgi:hypothetical protein
VKGREAAATLAVALIGLGIIAAVLGLVALTAPVP